MKTLFRRLKDYLIPPDPQGGCTWPSVDLTLPGDISLHLVGSIHMGSEAMYPLPGPLLERINHADGLIVEADITRPAPPFPGQDPESPRLPVSERLPEHLRNDYRRYCEEQRQPVQTLDTLPAWQVALILQSAQAQSLGLRPHYGIDYQMLNAAHGQNIPVFELEGTQAQLQMLLDFPDEGLSLLEDTLAYWHDNARALQIMLGWGLPAGKTCAATARHLQRADISASDDKPQRRLENPADATAARQLCGGGRRTASLRRP